MSRLVAPAVDEFAMFQEVVEAKRGARRTRLRNVSPVIQTRYAEYRLNTATFSALTASTLGSRRRKDCVHCYTGDTKALGKIKQAVIEARPLDRNFYCQYCLISEWDGLDHFAPKEQFPEFSVLPTNLIPCCPKCNRLKGDDWPATGPPVFNLYYDQLPDEPYLSVEIDFDAHEIPLLTFSIVQVAGISTPMFRRVKKHFETLNLLSRYDDAGIDAVLTYKQTCLKHDFADEQELENHLSQEAAGLNDQHGPNYWKALVAKSLADSDDFIRQILE